MKVSIKDLKPNPFRDFNLYPIDRDQVERLKASMADIGFFTGVTARKGANGSWEMAAGHHRVEAAEEVGIAEVDVIAGRYTDEEMVRIMVDENLLQRGYNAASVLDSVAAYVRIVAHDVLSGDGPTSKILEVDNQLAQNQTRVAKDGPGMLLVYRAMNGFSKAERREKKDVERITSTEIDGALAVLKTGGKMADIMGEVLAEVNLIRAEQDRIAAEEAERNARAEAKLEEDRKRAVERAQEAERKAKAAAEEAERKAKDKAETDKKKRAAAEAAAKQAAIEADKRRKEREAAEKQAAEERRKRDEEAKRQRDLDKAEHEKRQKERAAIEAQKRLDSVYDPRCVQMFKHALHEKVFREFVLSPNVMPYIKRDKQFALAQHIRAEVDRIEAAEHTNLGAPGIKALLDAEIARVWKMRDDISKQEKAELEKRSAVTRIEKQWADLKRGSTIIMVALESLVEEQQGWAYDKALFPVYASDLDDIVTRLEQIKQLKKRLGL